MFAAAAGAALGGTWHGFAMLDPPVRAVLWKATVLSIGASAAAMIAGSALAAAPRGLRRMLVALALVSFAAYAGWMMFHDAYLFVVIDTALAMSVIAILHAATWHARGSRAMVAAVALSVVAAMVQVARLAPHPAFNHNDLYHVLQMAAMALFYAGARELRDR